jgi:two-component system sensor histidine kinase PilS (NtrC family)
MASLAEIIPAESDLRRRLTYLMAFRVLLITLVMGATTLLYWLDDADLGETNSLVLYGIIAGTYLLTLVYATLLKHTSDYFRLANYQVVGDLIIASVMMHATGGVLSAYTFFFPLAIIGSAVVLKRRGAVIVAISATALFVGVSYLGWIEILPTLAGQRILPSDPDSIQFGRAMALNVAAIAGVGAMAVQLATQLQKSSASVEEHRSVAADLLASHENIIRCLSSGLITVDADSHVINANDAAMEILGRQASDNFGDSLEDLSPQLAALVANSPIDQDAVHGEVTHLKDNGAKRILGVSHSPLLDHNGNTVGRIVNFQDLTEVRALEEKIKRAERLTVVGTLAAGIAHEIRNPLASISGSIELLSTSPQADEESAALMEIVTREVKRLNAMITDLLAYSNPRTPNMMQIDLRVLIRETLRVFEQDPEFGEVTATFEGDTDTQSLPLEADPELLRQTIWNMLRNGAEAAMKGGKEVTVSAEASGEHALIRFRDSGPGIAQEYVAKVFDPFFTTKAGGTGLGLAMVHGTVTDHGGSISVDTEIGKGTTFELRLPYHQAHDS